MTPNAEDPRVAKILKLEERRRAALIAADIPMLDRLLADDLIHIHAGGNADTKPQYFSLVKNICEFMVIERPEIAIRFHGDVAIVTGPMKHTVRVKATREIRTMEAFGTQVWAPHGDTWQQVLYQATEIAPH
jgi:ketosteroid isomerase-like protein